MTRVFPTSLRTRVCGGTGVRAPDTTAHRDGFWLHDHLSPGPQVDHKCHGGEHEVRTQEDPQRGHRPVGVRRGYGNLLCRGRGRLHEIRDVEARLPEHDLDEDATERTDTTRDADHCRRSALELDC